jgi:eukaryotic-like serine/threonine-protein kinase
MTQILRAGQEVKTATSQVLITVEHYLGGGGQGEVYQVSLGGKAMALKWYSPTAATAEQRQTIETLLRMGAPNERFLWPSELVTAENVQGFGYVMPLRPASYKGIVDMMRRRVEPSFSALATAGVQLADSYLQLHAKGLCYRDISFGNVFFDPQTGGVLICDNDNVGVDGETKGGVLGTPRFMAPEIVRGEACPSTQSDLFSLSVLLFYMLMVHHPLEGAQEAAIRCLDLPAMTKLYGTDAVFIFDPTNPSNRPIRGNHDNALVYWAIYPQFLKNLFVRAFTDGIRDPQNGRVRESEWRAAMARLRDSIYYCSRCGAENFYDVDALRASNGSTGKCWSCRNDLSLPIRLRIGKDTVVMLNHDTKLFPHHIDSQRLYDYGQPVAELARHPVNPNIWGLKNLSSEKWVVAMQDGIRDVEPGRSVPLAVGTKVNFGKVEGEIRV